MLFHVSIALEALWAIWVLNHELQDMHHLLITCNDVALVSICHAFIACNSRARAILATPSLHAISELMIYMPCPRYMQFWSLGLHISLTGYMQFWSLRGIYQAIVTCSLLACNTYAISSIYAILEIASHKSSSITCNPRMDGLHAMLPLNAISELFSTCDIYTASSVITLYFFALLYITPYYIAP